MLTLWTIGALEADFMRRRGQLFWFIELFELFMLSWRHGNSFYTCYLINDNDRKKKLIKWAQQKCEICYTFMIIS